MIITKQHIEAMLIYAENLIPELEGKHLVPGDTQQIIFSFPEYTGDEEKFFFWLGNE